MTKSIAQTPDCRVNHAVVLTCCHISIFPYCHIRYWYVEGPTVQFVLRVRLNYHVLSLFILQYLISFYAIWGPSPRSSSTVHKMCSTNYSSPSDVKPWLRRLEAAKWIPGFARYSTYLALQNQKRMVDSLIKARRRCCSGYVTLSAITYVCWILDIGWMYTVVVIRTHTCTSSPFCRNFFFYLLLRRIFFFWISFLYFLSRLQVVPPSELLHKVPSAALRRRMYVYCRFHLLKAYNSNLSCLPSICRGDHHQELSDVCIYLCRLSDVCSVDLTVALEDDHLARLSWRYVCGDIVMNRMTVFCLFQSVLQFGFTVTSYHNIYLSI